MISFPSIGVQIPRVYLPRPGIDLTRWAVIACDQFTSQPEYWYQVEKLVGSNPSTYHLILPEVFLGTGEEKQPIHSIQATMHSYLDGGLLEPRDGFIYVERMVDGKTRRGLVLALDLERYDYTKGSTSLIRATEGTIVERLPPRMKIREGACLELPHILVLIDDPQRSVIEPLTAQKISLQPLYDFDLMLGSGHLRGFGVNDPAIELGIIRALENLAEPAHFQQKYAVSGEQPVLLFAMGDGNHSLATAKAVWEKIKPEVGLDHPARYALVEIENVHDEGLEFESIHRVLFDLKKNAFAAAKAHFQGQVRYQIVTSREEMVSRVDCQTGPAQRIGFIHPNEFGVLEITHPASNLPVGTLQPFLDAFLKDGGADRIDYVHGEDVVCSKGAQPGNAGFYLPSMHKSDLFKTVILDGALPRKTFSMGEAREKRFYMEARRIDG
ncbi:MAG TPA: DUF1015 domain-containing protein [Anaerolineaceae bacterium]|nr:DUF1015 domain-containing protein [Anaerolineaceae bacterium]